MQRLRELCTAHGALLVFDEVMTGFRVALGGAQSLYARDIPGFAPDLSVFGKVIGGGMPLAAFGGKRAVMEQLAPLGPVYQAGTLSGNPVATACGLATLREIAKPGYFDALATRTRGLVVGLLEAAQAAGVPMCADCEGGMFGFFFAAELPQNYTAVMATDKERFNRFFHAMLSRGVYLAPALYEAGFVSSAHSARRHRRDRRGGGRELGRVNRPSGRRRLRAKRSFALPRIVRMHLHVLGICGTFMGGLAALAREAGHRVTGCDANVYPPMSDQLQALGIELIEGYDAGQLKLAPDLFVVGNAITRGNPLMEAILDANARYTSGPQWLAEQILAGRHVLAVAGTHGKTGTTSMLAWILEEAGLDPGFLVGGVPLNFGVSARLGAPARRS